MRWQKLLLGIVVLVMSTVALADPTSWYIGGGFGRSHMLGVDDNTFLGNPSIDDWSWAGKAFVGYPINQNLAAELSYLYFGNVNINNMGKISPHAIEATLVGLLPVANNLSVGLDGGIYHDSYNFTGTISYADGLNHNPVDTFGFGYGGLIQYMLEQNAYLRAQYDQIIKPHNSLALRLNPQMVTLNLVIDIGGVMASGGAS